MKLFGWYDLRKNGTSIICFPTECSRFYDSQDEIFSQSMHVSFLKAEKRDLSFISTVMQVCKEYDYFSFAIMDDSISEDVLSCIFRLAKECFPSIIPQIIVPVKVASTYCLPDDIFIGSFCMTTNITHPQSFNAGTLRYSQFKALLPEAIRISESIRKMGLGKLESIIWIDNWFQENIQYIKDRESTAQGEVYVCPSIKRQAIVPDVFLNHYGTCEDIAVSVASVLSLIDIDYCIIQANAHAWLLVNLEDTYYVWDCTRNITRNEYRMENALKALAYSYLYTLISCNKFSNDYIVDSDVLPKASTTDYPRERIKTAMTMLSDLYQVSFSYEESPKYFSFKKQ